MLYGIEHPNVHYLTGSLLGSFITDYCEQHHIYCDEHILNNAFGCEGLFSEPEAIKLIETTAELWSLRNAERFLQTRN